MTAADPQGTQQPSVVHIDENTRRATLTVQWLLEKSKDWARAPIRGRNQLQVFICGEKAFGQIAKDLKHAKASVEIICWGFDPAMELTRDRANTWPRGETWGDVLRDVAAGKYNGGRPVQVRLLSWYGFIGSTAARNMPGYSHDRQTTAQRAAHLNADDWIEGMAVSAQDRRRDFNASWYQDAFTGALPNLAIRTRNNDSRAVQQSLNEEDAKRGAIEGSGLSGLPTDHQKTILIDYEHEGGAHAVGYVMGLNSVTDYWDTQQHLFKDPRRGQGWEGADDEQPGLKPYQDYACRIRGEALVEVSSNFTAAWNRAYGKGTPVTRRHDKDAAPAGLIASLTGPMQRAQVVRTQPQEGDKTIARLYHQASSFARRYIYVENQYFQHAQWVEQLKVWRSLHVKGCRAAGQPAQAIADLHLMVVIPTPERAQMVPRTYDAIKALGRGSAMPHQDKMVEDELELHREQQARWEAHMQAQAELGEALDFGLYPRPLSPIAQSAKEVGDHAAIAKDLRAMGLRALVASLWTFDQDWHVTQREQLRTLREWEDSALPRDAKGQDTGANAQRTKGLRDKLAKARYREIYIHSKLMLIDDHFFTLGSANLNLRSMAVDTEINVASDDAYTSRDLRQRVWSMLTGGTQDGGDGSQRTIVDTFKSWHQLMLDNALAKDTGHPLIGFLMPFEDQRTSRIRLG